MTEYIFKNNSVIHVLQLKASANTKLGKYSTILHTYHWSINQVRDLDFSKDKENCFNCPYSYNVNEGKSGGCYTHKGLQKFGLLSMLRRLNKLYKNNKINDYDNQKFHKFLSVCNVVQPELARLGCYGEPVTLSLRLIGKLVRSCKKHTGYTHNWTDFIYKGYAKYLMASTHNSFESAIANDYGWRVFESSSTPPQKKMPLCPASKEFTGSKQTCSTCAACNGTYKGNNKNIFIYKH